MIAHPAISRAISPYRLTLSTGVLGVTGLRRLMRKRPQLRRLATNWRAAVRVEDVVRRGSFGEDNTEDVAMTRINRLSKSHYGQDRVGRQVQVSENW